MNAEIGTEAAQFLLGEYLFQISGIVSLQCVTHKPAHSLATERDCLDLYEIVYQNKVILKRSSLVLPTLSDGDTKQHGMFSNTVHLVMHRFRVQVLQDPCSSTV